MRYRSSFLESLSISNGSNECIIAKSSTLDICGLFSSYTRVLWIEDSLARHSIMALYMLLTENYRTGDYNIFASLLKSVYRRCYWKWPDPSFHHGTIYAAHGELPNWRPPRICTSSLPASREERHLFFRRTHSRAPIIRYSKLLFPSLHPAKEAVYAGGSEFQCFFNQLFICINIRITGAQLYGVKNTRCCYRS